MEIKITIAISLVVSAILLSMLADAIYTPEQSDYGITFTRYPSTAITNQEVQIYFRVQP